MSRAYYNEIDPYAADWLRGLIAAKRIPEGAVDERDIRDVTARELQGYTQCHFFAGLGGWPVALRLAGWPDDKAVWTGSCPCQPFSQAGKGLGASDERHLWPAFFHLIRECRPKRVFGEQVASKDGIAWLDLVSSDLEGEDYACGPIILPACGVGAPHIRQRLWFVAVADREESERPGDVGQLGNAHQQRAGGHAGAISGAKEKGDCEGREARRQSDQPFGAGEGLGFWADAEWIPCADGKYRPTKPGLFPLAHGIPARSSKLRAIGNAIVPQVAAEIIEAAWEVIG